MNDQLDKYIHIYQYSSNLNMAFATYQNIERSHLLTKPFHLKKLYPWQQNIQNILYDTFNTINRCYSKYGHLLWVQASKGGSGKTSLLGHLQDFYGEKSTMCGSGSGNGLYSQWKKYITEKYSEDIPEYPQLVILESSYCVIDYREIEQLIMQGCYIVIITNESYNDEYFNKSKLSSDLFVRHFNVNDYEYMCYINKNKEISLVDVFDTYQIK